MMKDSKDYSLIAHKQLPIRQQVIGSTQSGAALIAVLLFLILIMLAGVVAVKQSNTDLKTATSDQINVLLLQSSESAHQKLESMVNTPKDKKEYDSVMDTTGPFGHFMAGDGLDNQGNEYIYCYNPRKQEYLIGNATIIKAGGGILNGINSGVCNYKNSGSYTNGRETTLTQMNITTTPVDPNQPPFTGMALGRDTQSSSSKVYTFDVRATSAIPAYNEPKDCFAQSSVAENLTGAQTLLECLNGTTTPAKMVLQQVDLLNNADYTKCVGYGKSALNAKEQAKAVKAKCTI